MAETAPRMPLSQNEAAALGVAVLGHVALVAALVWLKPADLPPPPPERMSVTISDETGLVSTSPNPEANPVLDSGPVLGDSAPALPLEPIPLVQAQPLPRPVPMPVPRPLVQPKAQPQAKPAQRPPSQPPRNQTPPRPGTKPGNSRFADAFGDGIPQGKPAGKGTDSPAQATGAQKDRWKSQIVGKVVARFGACAVSGLDIDKLSFDIRFTLTIDGQIESIGQVQVGGITAANRTQVEPLKACAMKAVKQAAPHTGLPPEYYNDWKTRNVRLRVKD